MLANVPPRPQTDKRTPPQTLGAYKSNIYIYICKSIHCYRTRSPQRKDLIIAFVEFIAFLLNILNYWIIESLRGAGSFNNIELVNHWRFVVSYWIIELLRYWVKFNNHSMLLNYWLRFNIHSIFWTIESYSICIQYYGIVAWKVQKFNSPIRSPPLLKDLYNNSIDWNIECKIPRTVFCMPTVPQEGLKDYPCNSQAAPAGASSKR